MTSFLKRFMSSRLPSWSWIPLTLFTVLLIHGSLLGLTDDEAYYWVLAQKPALGYAFHPPAVAWLIAAFQFLFGWAFDGPSAFLVRLPAAFSAALILGLALRWMNRAGVPDARMPRAAAVLLSFFGFFSLAWMIVPDLPLFAGWTLAFLATWEICFSEKDSRWMPALLFTGIALTLLSKYSGVLAAASSVFAIWAWAPRHRRWSGVLAVVAGGIAAAIPALVWNAQHEWGALLYQLRDRHGGGSLSWKRYLRFWGAEVLLAGPLLVAFSWTMLRRAIAGERIHRFALVWALPGLVFCIQPLWSDFKLHWAFVVWWPLALAFGWAYARGESHARFGKAQALYGFIFGAIVLVSCHFPLTGWVNQALLGHAPDPRWDVTNDLYGWSALGPFLRERGGESALAIPVVGSRYQTAAQAAFGIGNPKIATLLPRDLKARDEWPMLGVTDSEGPGWPVLKSPVWFVADNRYSEGPQFRGARCDHAGKIEQARWNLPAKSIDVWRCEPDGSRP